MTAFSQGLPPMIAGSSAQTRMSMTLPTQLSLIGAYAKWELLDADAHVWNSGDCGAVTAEQSNVNPSQKIVTAEANITIPSSVPANQSGTTYQIRYTLLINNQPIFAFDQVVVTPATYDPVGASDAVEMLGDTIKVTCNLPKSYEVVKYEVYQGNTLVIPARDPDGARATAEGVTYFSRVGGSELNASLDPYQIIWSYWDLDADYEDTPIKQRETGYIFVVNPLILDVAREVEEYINRAYTDSGIQPGTTFSKSDIIGYMRIGRDEFNAADKPTSITMMNATGPFKFFWVGYSAAAACRSQYLAEGMKAFQFGGQNVTLDVDRSQYWENLAQATEQALNEQIKPFKDNLYKRGIIDGDGSNLALRPGAVGTVGITMHGASPLRGGIGLGTFNGVPLWR